MTDKEELELLAGRIVEQIDVLLREAHYAEAKDVLNKSKTFREHDVFLNELCIISELDDIEREIGRRCIWKGQEMLSDLQSRYRGLFSALSKLDKDCNDAKAMDCVAGMIGNSDISMEGIESLAIHFFDKSVDIVGAIWNRVRDSLYPRCEQEPLVSVVITGYNHEKYIGDAIDSVMNQTYKNIEIIVTDDGSTDNTKAVIEEHIRKWNTDRIRMLHYDENTCFRCIEEAYRQAKGKYIGDIGGDDMIAPDKIMRQVSFLERNEGIYDACFSWVDCFGENKARVLGFEALFNRVNIPRKLLLKRMLTLGNVLNAPALLMRKDVWDELGGCDYSYRQLQDYDMWVRFLLHHNLYIIPEKLTSYRLVSGSVGDCSLTPDAEIRIAAEAEIILYEIMRAIPGKLMADMLEYDNSESYTDNDYRCMAIQFLLKPAIEDNNFSCASVAYRLFYEYRGIEGFQELLESKYGIGRRDIHKYAVEITPVNYLIRFQKMLVPYQEANKRHRLDLNNISKDDDALVADLKEKMALGVKAITDGQVVPDHILALFDNCVEDSDRAEQLYNFIKNMKL